MNSTAQSNVSSNVTHGAVNRIADIAGRKVVDIAMRKALPALREMDNKKIVMLAAAFGVGLIILRTLNRDSVVA